MLRDEVDLAKRQIYIGRTVFHHRDGKITRIEPLAKATVEGWKDVVAPRSLFPNEGLIFSFDSQLASHERDYIILFTTAPNSKDGTDRFVVEEWCEPYEIITRLETLGAEEQREIAVNGGIDRGAQVLPQVIIALSGDKCLFPELRNDAATSGWTISFQERLESLQAYELPLDRFGGTKPIIGRHFALPGHAPIKTAGIMNWQSPSECIEAVAKLLKKSDTLALGELSTISTAFVRKLAAAYQASDLFLGNERLLALRDRMTTIMPKLTSSSSSLDELVSLFASSPVVNQRIEQLVQSESKERLSQIEDELRRKMVVEIETTLSTERKKLEEVRDDISEALERKSIAERELAESLRAESDVRERCSALLTSSIRDLKSSGEGIRSLLELAGSATDQIGGSTNSSPPWICTSPHIEVRRIALRDLPPVLDSTATSSGLELRDLVRLDVLGRSGSIPILQGEAADLAISAYAACVSGGLVHRMQLDPSILGLSDLWTDPHRQIPTALAQAWTLAATNVKRCHVVVLEHLDSANLSDWLPLFRATFQRSRPPNLVALATARGASQSSVQLKQFAINWPVTLNVASAVLHQGSAIEPKSVLEGSILDDLKDAECTKLAGLCAKIGDRAVQNATQFREIARASKCWTAYKHQYGSLTEEIMDTLAS